ncbi:hypothetical protein D3C76_1480610 [compost metagenome]
MGVEQPNQLLPAAHPHTAVEGFHPFRRIKSEGGFRIVSRVAQQPETRHMDNPLSGLSRQDPAALPGESHPASSNQTVRVVMIPEQQWMKEYVHGIPPEFVFYYSIMMILKFR